LFVDSSYIVFYYLGGYLKYKEYFFNMEEEEYEDSKLKKVLVTGGAIFLILLVLSYMLTSFGVGTILASMIESDKIEGDSIDTGEFVVVFLNNTYEEVLEVYNEDLSVETKMCLFGYYDGDYYVTEVLKPIIHSQSFNQVVSEGCPEEVLISLHSHPYKQCLASEQDLDNLMGSKEVNPNALIGIICEEERFSFYS